MGFSEIKTGIGPISLVFFLFCFLLTVQSGFSVTIIVSAYTSVIVSVLIYLVIVCSACLFLPGHQIAALRECDIPFLDILYF